MGTFVEEGSDPLEFLRTAARSPARWRELCPWLHVEDDEMRQLAQSSVVPYAEGDQDLADRVDTWSSDLIDEGYFKVGSEEIPWAVDVASVARGVETLVAAGLPPSCIFAYDEPWVMAAQLSQLMRTATGGNEPIMDWAAFCVLAKPRDSASSTAGDLTRTGTVAAPAGWPPHRDRGADEAVANSFRADGSPRYTTFWVALSDATPETSCLMVVPRHKDPGYSKGDGGVSPLQAIFKTPEAFQHIRALPVQAGGLLAFSHRLLHWGSSADPRASRARTAIAFSIADPSYTEPYFSRSLLPLPPLGVRLALVAGQAFAYCLNESLISNSNRAELFWELFKTQVGTFDAGFVCIVAKHKAYLEQSFDSFGCKPPFKLVGASPDCVALGLEKSEEVEDEGGTMQDLFAGIG